MCCPENRSIYKLKNNKDSDSYTPINVKPREGGAGICRVFDFSDFDFDFLEILTFWSKSPTWGSKNG